MVRWWYTVKRLEIRDYLHADGKFVVSPEECVIFLASTHKSLTPSQFYQSHMLWLQPKLPGSQTRPSSRRHDFFLSFFHLSSLPTEDRIH
jgi:hypothetical protein